jgi:uncharacterized protein YjbJ (UPF0337 family)
MGVQDKIANRVAVLKGKAKEAAGKITGKSRWEVEGKLDQVKGNLRQAGEKVKDVFRK